MLDLKILIFEFFTIYGITASAILVNNVSTLSHKVWNNSVKFVAFVVEGLALCIDCLTSCNLSEVFDGLWNDFIVHKEDNDSGMFTSNFDNKENGKFKCYLNLDATNGTLIKELIQLL